MTCINPKNLTHTLLGQHQANQRSAENTERRGMHHSLTPIYAARDISTTATEPTDASDWSSIWSWEQTSDLSVYVCIYGLIKNRIQHPLLLVLSILISAIKRCFQYVSVIMPKGQMCLFIISDWWKKYEFSEHRAGLNSRGCQRRCCCLMKVCKPSLSKQLFPNFKSEACYRPPQSAAHVIDTQDGEQVVQKPSRCFWILQLSLTSVSKTEITAAGVCDQMSFSAQQISSIMTANLSRVCTENHLNNQLLESVSKGILNISSFSNVVKWILCVLDCWLEEKKTCSLCQKPHIFEVRSSPAISDKTWCFKASQDVSRRLFGNQDRHFTPKCVLFLICKPNQIISAALS